MIIVRVAGARCASVIPFPIEYVIAEFCCISQEKNYVDYEFPINEISSYLIELNNTDFKFTVRGGN